jgi:uncharacterized protein YecE (DUF72 family)
MSADAVPGDGGAAPSSGPGSQGSPGILSGTSGFAFAEWKGTFYPTDLPNARMLSHYAAHLPTVEINVSFYRTPTTAMLEAWKDQVPETFRFALKAHRRITHMKRLRDVDDDVRLLHERLAVLGGRLGPVLFQLPPSFRKDLPVLEQFLAGLPPFPFVTVEFRHASWHDDDVYGTLRKYRAALCIAEDETACEPLVHTASFAYYRLHRLRYADEQIAAWADHLRGAPGARPAFCYFTHETGPEAIAYARRLMELTAAPR